MVEVVRLNFQRNWTTPGGFTICKSQLFKVINTGKTFSNVFISLQLTKNDAQCQNDVKSMPIKITSKKVSKNDVHISTIEITAKKVRGNHVDFSSSEITSKKYTEMTWKFVEIWSSTYRRNIHVELTWIRRGVPVGLYLN